MFYFCTFLCNQFVRIYSCAHEFGKKIPYSGKIIFSPPSSLRGEGKIDEN
jgi:hypothetical protein